MKIGNLIAVLTASAAIVAGGSAISTSQTSEFQGQRFNHTESGQSYFDIYWSGSAGSEKGQVYRSEGEIETFERDGNSFIFTNELGNKRKVILKPDGREEIQNYGTPDAYLTKMIDLDKDGNRWRQIESDGSESIYHKTDRGLYNETDKYEEILIKNGRIIKGDDGSQAVLFYTDYGCSYIAEDEGVEINLHLDRNNKLLLGWIEGNPRAYILYDINNELELIDEELAISIAIKNNIKI